MAFTSSVSSSHSPSTSNTPARQGYCEGVVGRFAAAHVHFNGKLKTLVVSKRSSSTSKSPRPRSLTPSRGQQSSQSPVPSISRASSREEDSSHGHPSSSIPSVPNPLTIGHPHPFSETSPRSDASAESSHQDLLVTHSSSSSVQESASPPTPSEPYLEPHLRDQSRPSIFSDTSHSAANVSPHHATHSLPQNLDAAETLPSGLSHDILGIVQPRSQSVDMPPSAPPPPSPPRMESSNPRLSLDNASSAHLSRLSVAMSDGAAGIGLSMLQGFLSGNIDDDDDEDDEEDDGNDDDDSDHEFSSQSERERTSLEEAVDGFPAPPTQIPTPSSRATSFVLDAHRPVSLTSEYSEDGDGASFYDNYRYSRLSISSKMSKSSGYTATTAPPPVPTELPPPVGHSQDSQDPVSPPSEPLSSPSEAPSVSPPPLEIPQPMTIQATRTIPPPLDLGNSALGPEPSELVTATASSPLLHPAFSSPKSSPTGPNNSIIRSPVSATFDFRGSGAASALRQKIESDRGISSPLPSPLRSTISDEHTSEQSQSIVVKDEEGDVPGIRGTQPLSPTSPTVSPSSTAPEKMKRGGMAPLVVMNPAPPPPYSPRSPLSSESSPTFGATSTPAIMHLPLQAVAELAGNTLPTSLFPPHPNAPKPNLSPQGPLYGRVTELVPSLPSNLLIQTMRRATQMRVMPNGLPRFSTIYGSTTQDLSAALGPVPILFSIDPPNDIPAKRIAAATAPPPVPTSIQNTHSPAPGVQQLPVQSQAATPNVIPRESFVPKAGAVRPRSRSFSGFDSPLGAGTPPKEQRFVLYLNFWSRVPCSFVLLKDGPFHSKSTTNARPSTADSASSSQSNAMTARAAAHTARIHQARQYTPSPLSLSQTSTKPTTSPSDPSVSSSLANASSSPASPTLRRTLVPMKSEPSLRAGPSKSPQEREASPQSSAKPDVPALSRVPHSSTTAPNGGAPPSIQISLSESQVLSNRTNPANRAPFSRQLSAGSLPRKTSTEIEPSSPSDSRLPTSAPSSSAPLGRSGSLRSKISLSALRAKSLRDDDVLHDGDTVQVKDTDFELVRPNTTRPRVSEDSTANSKSSGSEGRPSFLRVESPATSTTSGGASDTRSPVSPSAMSLPPMTAAQTITSSSAVEAHRARELKWVSAMSSTPPSHARKSKKIRKLLQEGVPASVRYQVWAHLTDSRAKRIEGLYAQLGDRERVPAFAEIQRDAHLYFPGDARLSQPNGPLVTLLQAYLTMVPDIQYCKGGILYRLCVLVQRV